jgi:sterol desaturase/sphingolipid hydroxylase (fatty acid hydroxylase superfamily)
VLKRIHSIAMCGVRCVIALAIVIVMSWVGANARSAAIGLASFASGAAFPESPALVLLALRLIRLCLLCFGEPIIIVLAFLVFEAVCGIKLRFDRTQAVVWSCFILAWFSHTQFTRFLHLHMSFLLPVGCYDIGFVLPALRGSVYCNVLNFASYLVFTDFGLYWLHRMSHANRLLWRFHAVHHSYVELSALESLFHPADLALRVAIVEYPLMMIVGYNEASLPWMVTGFYFVHDRFVHSKAAPGFGLISRVVCDNRLHFVHHSSSRDVSDSNFATMFPFIDMIYGTYRAPQQEGFGPTGIEGRRPPVSAIHFLCATLDKREDC